jgi:hypothetical protein
MALVNPNIAMGFRQPEFQVPNALAQYAQIQQIQGGQQAQEINALKMQEAQAAMQERNALRQLNPSSPDYEEQVFRLNPQLGIAFRKERSASEASAAATAASRAAAEKSGFDLKSAQRKFGEDLKRSLSSNPSDENIIAFGQDAVLQGLYSQDKADATVKQFLAIPVENRASIFSQAGASAAELRPQVVTPGGSLVQGGKAVFTAPPTPSPINKLLQERAALLESGVPQTDPRIQAYNQALAAGESQSMKMQRELQVAIANNAPPAVIAQLQRDIKNLHPGLAMQNVVGVDANGNQIVTRFSGAGGGSQGQFALNQSPTGTARAMLGLSDTDSALLFGPGGPIESGQIPVAKLTPANVRMYVAAIKANPALNLTNLSEDQILQASKAKAQGNIQGKQVLTLADRATAKNIAEGNLPPLTGPNSTRIMNEVIAMKPDFKANDYGLQTSAVKAFNQGIQGNKVRSLNVVMEHFNTLEKAADALQSGDVRAINAVSQYIQTQTGKPAPGNFNAVKEILADEIVAAVVPGTGALADRVALKKTILASASPEQLKGVVANYKELIGGQLTGLEKQYSAGTGRADFKSRYLTPAAVQGLAPSSQYVETKTLPDGRTLGKKADGTVEEIK